MKRYALPTAVAAVVCAAVLAVGWGPATDPGHRSPTPTPPAASPATPVVPEVTHWIGTDPICQREEGGEVIEYPTGLATRQGWSRVPCPGTAQRLVCWLDPRYGIQSDVDDTVPAHTQQVACPAH